MSSELKKAQAIDLKQCRAAEEQISYVEDQMAKCRDLSIDMMNLLEGFEGTLINLERTILPLQQRTKRLTIAQNHIDCTISETDKVIEHHNVANELDRPERDINLDWRGYLEWINKLVASKSFFTEHSHFKSSKESIVQLRRHTAAAQDACKGEFKRLVEFHVKPLDRIPKQLPEKLELVHSSVSDRISRIAGAMDMLGYTNFVKHIVSNLEKTLLGTLEHVEKKQKNEFLQTVNVLHLPLNKDAKRERKKGNEDKQKQGRYIKGSHRVLYHFDFFLKLVAAQAELLAQLLAHCNKVSSKDQVFEEILETAFEYFRTNCVIQVLEKERGANRLLLALDILEKFNDMFEAFSLVFSTQLLVAFRIQLTTIAREGLAGYAAYIGAFDRPVLRNGTVYTLVVETLNFLKRLRDYSVVLMHVERTALLPPSFEFENVPGNLRPITHLILGALDDNLQAKAKAFKHRVLASIFLLNNNSHIVKQVVDEDEFDVGPTWLRKHRADVLSAKKEYMDASWGEVVQILDVKVMEDLAAQCTAATGPLPKSLRQGVKNIIKKFNSRFDKARRLQHQFAVPDSELRAQLRQENTQLIVPLYTRCYELFIDIPFTSKDTKVYLEHPPAKLEETMNRLYNE